jgi:hypothetical protein
MYAPTPKKPEQARERSPTYPIMRFRLWERMRKMPIMIST